MSPAACRWQSTYPQLNRVRRQAVRPPYERCVAERLHVPGELTVGANPGGQLGALAGVELEGRLFALYQQV